jgi:hypothetical protein
MSNGSRASAPEESTIDENMIDEKSPTGHDGREYDEIRARDRR